MDLDGGNNSLVIHGTYISTIDNVDNIDSIENRHIDVDKFRFFNMV